MITQQLKDAWLAELRNPANKQVRNTLFEENVDCAYSPHRQYEAVLSAKCMCALGCLIKAHAKNSNEKTYQHKQIQHALHPDIKFEIISMNDDRYRSFSEIADWVKEVVKVGVIG